MGVLSRVKSDESPSPGFGTRTYHNRCRPKLVELAPGIICSVITTSYALESECSTRPVRSSASISLFSNEQPSILDKPGKPIGD